MGTRRPVPERRMQPNGVEPADPLDDGQLQLAATAPAISDRWQRTSSTSHFKRVTSHWGNHKRWSAGAGRAPSNAAEPLAASECDHPPRPNLFEHVVGLWRG